VAGSRLRPLLVAWGYLLSGSDFSKTQRTEVANLAVYVELLHKATLLIDDFLDGDNARHGLPAFHAEFSGHEAVLFAIYLLGDCLDRLSSAIRPLRSESGPLNTIDLLSRAIRNMALGALEEVNLSREEFGSIQKIKRIMELQTAALIKNGLLVGYRSGGGDPPDDRTVDSLGNDAGYMFQVFNDLEPFYAAHLNSEYKGAENTDIGRFRKNLTVAVLLTQLNTSDRREFDRLRESSASSLGIKCEEWLYKYNILERMGDNLLLVKRNIDRSISTLSIADDRRNGFAAFVDYVLSMALSRLDAAPRQKLLEMMIS